MKKNNFKLRLNQCNSNNFFKNKYNKQQFIIKKKKKIFY